MKLFTTVAVGALLLAGCAPFEHGHFAADVSYQNNVGDRPGTPVLVGGGYQDPFYAEAIGAKGSYSPSYSTPATYSTPINRTQPARYVEPVYSAPVTQTYVEPIVHPAPVIQTNYVHSQPVPIVHTQPAPIIHSQPAPIIHSQPAQIVHSQPLIQASYPAPIIHSEPAPIIHAEPIRPRGRRHHRRHRGDFVEVQPYVEPPHYVDSARSYEVDQFAHVLPEPRRYESASFVETAPIASALPLEKPRHYVDATPIHQEPIHQPPIYDQAPPVIAAATSVSVEEERIQAPTVYAPPSVVNAAPVYMRGAPQYANQPYPAPGYGQFGGGFQQAPAYAPPPNFGAPQGYGFPQGYGQPQGFGGYSPQPYPAPPGFGGGGYYGGPVAANARPAYAPQGFGGYGASGCVTTCGGGSVF